MKYEYAYLNNKIRDGMMSNAMRMIFYLITLIFLKYLVEFYLISLFASHVFLPRLQSESERMEHYQFVSKVRH